MHQQVHPGEMTYMVCSDTSTHPEEKLYHCSLCGRSFNQREQSNDLMIIEVGFSQEADGGRNLWASGACAPQELGIIIITSFSYNLLWFQKTWVTLLSCFCVLKKWPHILSPLWIHTCLTLFSTVSTPLLTGNLPVGDAGQVCTLRIPSYISLHPLFH